MSKKAFNFEPLLQDVAKSNNSMVENSTGDTTQYVSKKSGKTYKKHNFMFNTELLDKIQLLQRRLGMSQRETIETMLAYYIAQYEKEFGKLTNEKLQTL